MIFCRVRLAAIGCLLSLVHCADDRPLINVTVMGLTPSVYSLDVAATLAGLPTLGGSPRVPDSLDRFDLRLPSGAAGDFQLRLSGEAVDGCFVAEGSGNLVI